MPQLVTYFAIDAGLYFATAAELTQCGMLTRPPIIALLQRAYRLAFAARTIVEASGDIVELIALGGPPKSSRNISPLIIALTLSTFVPSLLRPGVDEARREGEALSWP